MEQKFNLGDRVYGFNKKFGSVIDAYFYENLIDKDISDKIVSDNLTSNVVYGIIVAVYKYIEVYRDNITHVIKYGIMKVSDYGDSIKNIKELKQSEGKIIYADRINSYVLYQDNVFEDKHALISYLLKIGNEISEAIKNRIKKDIDKLELGKVED